MTPEQQQAVANAAEVYGAILADPDRRAEILAHRRSVAAAQTAAGPARASSTARPGAGQGQQRKTA